MNARYHKSVIESQRKWIGALAGALLALIFVMAVGCCDNTPKTENALGMDCIRIKAEAGMHDIGILRCENDQHVCFFKPTGWGQTMLCYVKPLQTSIDRNIRSLKLGREK